MWGLGETGRDIAALSQLFVALLWMGRDGGSTRCPDSQPWISHLFILDCGKFLMLSVLLQVLPEEAKEHWESSYHFSLKNCNHAVW